MQKNGHKKEQPLVSVIVSNYNGKKYLKRCFESLFEQTYPNIEMILADDCSTDGSVAYMQEHFPQVTLTVNPVNSGLSVTSNAGAAKATGKYLLFYNNDTYSYPDFIEEMVKTIENDSAVGVVCPIQLPYLEEADTTMTEDRKDIGTGSDIYGYVCTAKDAGHVFYPDAAIFIKKDLFEKIGKFDPDFRLYGEDMDLCWRVHLLGYKIKVSPKARFRHDSFCSMQDETGSIITSYKRRYLVERQVINKLFKYYMVGTLLRLLPSFILYYLAEALFFLLVKFDLKMFFSVYVNAVVWNLKKLKDTLAKRKYIQSIRVVEDSYILNLMYPKYRKLFVARKLGIPVMK